jgi:hypothetical protein
MAETQGKNFFTPEERERHKRGRTPVSEMLKPERIPGLLTVPVIYSLIIPVTLMDMFITVYQTVCFPVYKIPRVRRGDYVVMDRKYLPYLNPIEKVNCLFCEYANGVIAYAREVAARTEWFWCPIKHARQVRDAHDHYGEFLEYGDGENYRAKLMQKRDKCRACEAGCGKK